MILLLVVVFWFLAGCAVVALLHGAAVRDDEARWDVERDETFDARARWRDEGDDAA